MQITSSAFQNNSKIPSVYTCDGKNINPPLSFSDIAKNAKSLVLIMDDPDAPMGTFVHWVLFDINPEIRVINEDSIPDFAIQGLNSANKAGYVGPCPPSGSHRYFFKLYAVDTKLDFVEKPNKKQLEEKMKNHIIDKAELIGLYSR